MRPNQTLGPSWVQITYHIFEVDVFFFFFFPLRNQMKLWAFIRSSSLSLSKMKLHKFIHMVKILTAS